MFDVQIRVLVITMALVFLENAFVIRVGPERVAKQNVIFDVILIF
jgi:hypothetical protein